MTIYGRSEELVSRCVECDLAEPESLASLGGSALELVDGILSPSGSNSPSSGFVEGFLNGVFVDPAKIGPELLKVNELSCDSMFVLSNVGDGRGTGEGMLNSPFKIAKFIYPGVMCKCWEGSRAQVGSPDVVGWVYSRTEGSHSWGPVRKTWG